MKIPTSLILALGLLVCAGRSSGQNQDPAAPLLTITLKSERVFFEQAGRILKAVQTESIDDFKENVLNGIGFQNDSEIDQERPWQVAIWMPAGGGTPYAAMYVPVKDFDSFKKSLDPEKFDSDRPNEVTSSGQHALITRHLNMKEPTTEADLATARAWQTSLPKSADHGFALSLNVNEAVRAQALGMLTFGRMAMTQNFNNPELTKQPGFNAQAMTDIMGLYFDGFETFIRGLDHLDFTADVGEDYIQVTDRVKAVEGSRLAGFLKRSDGNLSTVRGYLDPNASASFAMRLSKDLISKDFLTKATALSLQMQNQTADPEVMKRMETLLDSMLPLSFAGSVDMSSGYHFSGLYQFLEGRGDKAYESMVSFMKEIAPKLVGKEAMYSDFNIQQGASRLQDLPVDQITLAINTNSPAFQAPGQMQVLESLWPNGKMQINLLHRGDRLFIASGVPLEKVVQTTNYQFPYQIEPATAAFGTFNWVTLMKGMMAANPMLPDQLKDRFKKMESEGTEIPFKVDINGDLAAQSRIPLALLRQFRHLHEKN